jgi:hypothetical protein
MFRRKPTDMSVSEQEKADTLKNIIENCTSDMLMGVDWANNMELIDQINRTSSPTV